MPDSMIFVIAVRRLCSILAISMKDIQTWLGHSNYSFTANTYVHSSKDSHVQMAQSFADKLPELLPPPVEAVVFECLPEEEIVAG